MNFEDIFKQQTGVLDCEVITRSVYNDYRHIKIVKYLRICSTYTAWLGFIQNLRETPLDIPGLPSTPPRGMWYFMIFCKGAR